MSCVALSSSGMVSLTLQATSPSLRCGGRCCVWRAVLRRGGAAVRRCGGLVRRRGRYVKEVSREAKGCLAATLSTAAVIFLPQRSSAIRPGSCASSFLVASGERLLCLSG